MTNKIMKLADGYAEAFEGTGRGDRHRAELQAEVARVETLLAESKELGQRYVARLDTMRALREERDELRAKLEALEKQEPVAISEGGVLLWIADKLPRDPDRDDYLYLAAGAKEKP